MLSLTAQYRLYLAVECGLTQSTIKQRLSLLVRFQHFVTDFSKDLKFETVSVAEIKNFIIALQKNNISAKTQADYLGCLRSFYRFLELNDYIGINPLNTIDNPTFARKLPEVLSIYEIEKMIDIQPQTKKGIRNRALIDLIYSAGLRISEAINLNEENIDFKECSAFIVGKGRKERYVVFGAKAKENLQSWMTIKAAGKKLFPLTVRAAYNIVAGAARSAEIKKNVSPHTLRHSFATHLLEGGANLFHVQDLLGHSSVTTTEIYGRVTVDHLRTELNRFHPSQGKRQIIKSKN